MDSPTPSPTPNISITSHDQRGGFTGINQGTVNLGAQSRTISPEDRQRFKALVATATKGHVDISVSTDADSASYGEQLASLFREAGYKAEVTSSFTGVANPPMLGLLFEVHDGTNPPPFANALRTALFNIQIDNKGSVNQNVPNDIIRLCIWPRGPKTP